MEIFVVRRDSIDGLEVDCFLEQEKAERWAKWINSRVEVENTLDDSLPALFESY